MMEHVKIEKVGVTVMGDLVTLQLAFGDSYTAQVAYEHINQTLENGETIILKMPAVSKT